jgi:hypothetical protein
MNASIDIFRLLLPAGAFAPWPSCNVFVEPKDDGCMHHVWVVILSWGKNDITKSKVMCMYAH